MAQSLIKANPLPPLTKLEGPRWFQARAIARGIQCYLDTGMMVNTSYTPANMRRTASNITGRTYPGGRSGLIQAAADLTKMAPPA